MAFSGLQQGILVRVVGLLGTLALLAWMVVHTSWYVTIALCVAAAVTQMMEQVLAKGGTAYKVVKLPGYAVAGKTGTAQVADSTCRCYRGYTASFAGFAPADAPQIAISVTLQQPEHGHFGGALGGPVFDDVMSFALQALGIRPTGVQPARIPITW